MAYINFKPSDYFATKTYTGNGSTNTIVTGVDNDMVWIKGNSVTNHEIFDTVRGVYKYLSTNSDGSENSAYTDNLTAFNSNGFTLGANSPNDINVNLTAYTSWNWKAGTTTGKTTSGETITPTAYSINPTSGIGMYAYTGTGANGTIAHGLSSAPKFIMVKRLNVAGNWMCGGSIVGTGLSYNNLNNIGPKYDNATI